MLDLIIIRQRYLIDDVIDGDITESTIVYDLRENLDLHEAIELCRREGVTFAATGNDWAANPDGSTTIDYATGMEEAVSIHPQGSWWPWEVHAWQAGVDGPTGESAIHYPYTNPA